MSLNSVTVYNVPLLGRIRIVRDIQGYIQIGIVIFYWIYGTVSTFSVILLPQYHEEKVSVVFLIVYGCISALCITSLFKAATINPGPVPNSYNSQPPGIELEQCDTCENMRPMRAHHCRRCDQCVLKMDHHCPWINNCVGEENHYAFIQLIAYAFILSAVTFILDVLHFTIYSECKSCDENSFFVRHSYGLVVGSIIMAVLMMMLSCGLIVSQSFLIMLNMTTVEWMRTQTQIKHTGNWELMPQPNRHILVGCAELCGMGSMLTWPFPCRKRRVPPPLFYPDLV